MFELVQQMKFKTVAALLSHAAREAEASRGALADYCTRQGHKLEEQLANAWAVLEAPQKALDAERMLVEKPWLAATSKPCICGGTWGPGDANILQNNNIFVQDFCGVV